MRSIQNDASDTRSLVTNTAARQLGARRSPPLALEGAAPRIERLPKRPYTTPSETYNRHTYEERRFLPLRRRRGRRGGDASSVAATGGGGTGGGLSNNRNASPDVAVKSVEDSQKR